MSLHCEASCSLFQLHRAMQASPWDSDFYRNSRQCHMQIISLSVNLSSCIGSWIYKCLLYTLLLFFRAANIICSSFVEEAHWGQSSKALLKSGLCASRESRSSTSIFPSQTPCRKRERWLTVVLDSSSNNYILQTREKNLARRKVFVVEMFLSSLSSRYDYVF